MSDKEGEGFVIKDKRSSRQSEEEAKAADESQKKEQPAKEEPPAPSAELNFSTFVLSMASSAFYHLGDIPDPMTGQKQENLPAVKQTIDILIMLQDKTKNNVDAEEAKLMEQLIYELQMKYVAKKPK